MVKYNEIKPNSRGKEVFKLQEFGSIHEFVDYLSTSTHRTDIFGSRQDSMEKGDKSWKGTDSFDEALDLLGNGWTTMAQKLSKSVPTVSTTGSMKKTRPAYSVVGGQASVPRYIQGIPTNMIDRKPDIRKQKIVVINKDMTYSGATSSHTIQEEGIKALQIIQKLENSGFRVKLNMCFASQSGSETVAVRLTVKKPEERLSISKIAFPIAHPAMLRRLGFRWIESHPTMESHGYRGGYGKPCTNSLKAVLDKKEIFLPNHIPDIDKYIETLKLK